MIETDKGEILTENAVILQYLADSNHADKLLPKVSDFERYRVLEWLNFVATEIHKGFGPLFNPNFPQEVKEKFTIPNLLSKFKLVSKRLESNEFLTGFSFTLPDAYLFVMLNWAKVVKLDIFQLEPLARYFNEMHKRPSIIKSLKEEGIHH